MGDVEFRILGPLEVLIDGVTVAIGGPRQRALLATLLLSANQVVSRDRLIDELTGEAAPDTADHALRVQVSRLRKVLSAHDGLGERLLSRPPGYLFRVEARELDLLVFQQRLNEGRAALDEGRAALDEHALERAVISLREADSLWRGPPLADLGSEPFARIEVARLEELRLAAVEDRIDAELALGRHTVLVAELEALVAKHPLRERLRGQLMLALYRCGRQADALDTYRAGRELMSDQLALEPGRALRDLERSILNQHPALDLPPRADGAVTAAVRFGQRPTGSAPSPQGAVRPAPIPKGKHRRHGRALPLRLGLPAAAAALVLALALSLIAPGGRGEPPLSGVAANSVGVISQAGGSIRAVVQLSSPPQELAAGDGAVWATNLDAGTVTRIDTATRAVVDTITVGSPTGIAVGAGSVWVVSGVERSISRIDPDVQKVVQRIPVGSNANGVAVGAGSLWVANTNSQTLTRIDPLSGKVRSTVHLGVDATNVAADRGGVWVSDIVDGRVIRVDPRTNQISQSVNVGHGPAAIAVGEGSVWVANSLDGTVSRIDPQTNAVAATIPVGEGPAAIAVDRGAVWVANQYAGTISRIDPATNTARTITIGNRPAGIAIADGMVWVGTQAGATGRHRGGTLTILTVTAPGDLDPLSISSVWVHQWTLDGLTAYKRVGGLESARVVPDLAASLPTPTNGGKTYTFQLRRGIRYSNGAPVRPGDFRRALERDLTIGPNPLTGDYFANVVGGAACVARPSHCDLSDGVVVNDEANTVVFHLVAPNPEFLKRLSLADAAPVPAGTPAQHIGSRPFPTTGPYEVASSNRAQTTLVRNPYFHEWSRAARPDGYPDRIVMRVASSASDEVAAVQQGRADVAMDPPPPDRLGELRTRYASQLHILTCLCNYSLILNSRVPPFNDIRVRQALNYAVDRGHVADLVGAAAQPTCQALTPWFTGYVRQCPYTLHPNPRGMWRAPDVTTAQRLNTASHTRGTPVTVWLSWGVPAAVGRYLVTLLDRLGFTARLRDVSAQPNWYAQIADSRKKAQAFAFYAAAPYPAASQLIETFFGCKYFVPNSPLNGNIAEFCDPRLDAQIAAARAAEASNSPDVAQQWAKADRIVTDAAPQVPLVIPGYTVFVSKRVGNYQTSASQGLLQDQLWVR